MRLPDFPRTALRRVRALLHLLLVSSLLVSLFTSAAPAQAGAALADDPPQPTPQPAAGAPQGGPEALLAAALPKAAALMGLAPGDVELRVEVQGDWAVGRLERVTPGPARALPVLLARRQDGRWQVAAPSRDGLYPHWLAQAPAELLPTAEAEALAAVWPAPAQAQPGTTALHLPQIAAQQAAPPPAPPTGLELRSLQASAAGIEQVQVADWVEYVSAGFGYTIQAPQALAVEDRRIGVEDAAGVPSDVWFGDQVNLIVRIPPLPDETIEEMWGGALALPNGEQGYVLDRVGGGLDGAPAIFSREYLWRTEGADYILGTRWPEDDTSGDARRRLEQMAGAFRTLPTRSYDPPVRAAYADADGFDYPFSSGNPPPPHASYNANNGDLTDTAPCYNRPYFQLQHAGEDWFRSAGTQVKAVANGRVIWAANANYPGTVVIIEHALRDGWTSPWGGDMIYSMYGHLATSGYLPQWSDVSRGQNIGSVYNWNSNSHLHLEMRRYGDMSFLICPSNRRSSWPGPGYTNAGEHPDTYGYTHPSNWISGHRPGGGGGDTTDPTGSITSPNEGAVITSRTVRLAANVSDSGSGVARAHFTVNWGSGWRTLGPNFSSNTDWTWDMCNDGVPNGQITIGLDIWDNAGNEANSPGGVRHFVKSYDCSPPPPACNPGSNQVALYANTGHSGSCVTLGIGQYPSPGSLGGLGNDNAESIRVGSQVRAVLFEHNDYQGRQESFTGDDGNLSDNTIGGNSVSSVRVEARVQAPGAPSLTGPADGYSFVEGESITLQWSGSGSDYYGEIYDGPGGTLTFGWQGESSRTIGAQWPGYTYRWRVKARNGAGESGWSVMRSFSVRPNAPSSLSVQALSCREAVLHWADNSQGEDGYEVLRDNSVVARLGLNSTSHQDSGLEGDRSYLYTVRAVKNGIASEHSSAVTVITPPCAVPKPDLIPAQWTGWQYPIVPSFEQGTSQVGLLFADAPTYIDWGVANIGSVATPAYSTYGDFHIDDRLVARSFFGPDGGVEAGQSWAYLDWAEYVQPGLHTLTVIADPDNLIDEVDENNNEFSMEFLWLTAAPFSEDWESGAHGWQGDGLWQQVGAGHPYAVAHSGSSSWWYGDTASGTYDTGSANSGGLRSPALYIPDTGYALRFNYTYETEPPAPFFDRRIVQVATQPDGPYTDLLVLGDDNMGVWHNSPPVDLSTFAGQTIYLRFWFDTVDDVLNGFRGWYIDDVVIEQAPAYGCRNSYEYGDSLDSAVWAELDGIPLHADICPNGDVDYYVFVGQANETIVVDVDAHEYGSSLDAVAFVLDGSGAVLAENDDEPGGGVLDPKLAVTLPTDDVYYVKIRSYHHPSFGDSDHTYALRLWSDINPPVEVIIDRPADHEWISESHIPVEVRAQDEQSGVQRVEFLWHDGDWSNPDWVWLGADESARDGFSYAVPVADLPDQTSGAIYVWAFDWAGNWNGAMVWGLGLDRRPPEVALHVEPAFPGAPAARLTWSARSEPAHLADMELQVRAGDGQWAVWQPPSGMIYGWDYFAGQGGRTYSFRFRATDAAGNISPWAVAENALSVPDCAPTADAFEDDDSADDARTLAVNAAPQARGLHDLGDRDWVRFEAVAGVEYRIRLENVGGDATMAAGIYEPGGDMPLAVVSAAPGDAALEFRWPAPATGAYLLNLGHVTGYGFGCTTSYTAAIYDDRTYQPPTGSVQISGGAAYAATRDVTLALAAVGANVTEMRISTDPTFAGAAWRPFARSAPWRLGQEGVVTVYAQFRDGAGNTSPVYEDSIIADWTPPSGRVTLAAGQVHNGRVTVRIDVQDASPLQMRGRVNSGAWSAWQEAGSEVIWPVPGPAGTYALTFEFRDAAGNRWSTPPLSAVVEGEGSPPAMRLFLPRVVAN